MELEHSCQWIPRREVTFLDVLVTLQDGKITTDMFELSLQIHSFTWNLVTRDKSFNLALRITTIVSGGNTGKFLRRQGYPEEIISHVFEELSGMGLWRVIVADNKWSYLQRTYFPPFVASNLSWKEAGERRKSKRREKQ